MIWYIVIWYVMVWVMKCDYAIWLLWYMIWYDMYLMRIVMSGSMKRYDMTYVWYDWHAKWWTSMKYNSDIHMKDMINYMKNNMRNEMTKWYDRKEDWGCIKW